ncbi:hypothetical protein TWF718_007199 [Orbilia javanica]|uniref:Fungal STAND N-terminal Goodbye domain-containing protein n=1 Tax=Orbilia javanica TaxID=47235 RepID=A0AAN8MP29_9PEZI
MNPVSPSTQAHPNPAQEARFLKIWDAALEKYKIESGGKDLGAIQQLPDPKNLEAFRQNIESSQEGFDRYREINRSLWGPISNSLAVVEMLGGVVAQGATVAFQASPAIMAAVEILIKATKGVSQSYDYIQELFNEIGSILSRLQIHTRKDLPVELRELYIEILACVLEVIGVSTKYIKEGRMKRFIKRLLKPDDSRASDLRSELQALVGRESTLVGALNLEATGSVLERSVLTGKILNKIDSKIDDVADSVEQISKRVEGSRSQDSKTTATEALEKIKEKLDPQLDLEDDLNALKCLGGTGDWVLTEPLIQRWIDGNIPLLRLSGGPGAGKSHISSFLVRHLLEIQKKNRKVSVGYFFFKENDPSRNCFAIALRTIAYQLALSDPTYRRFIGNKCQDIGDIKKLANLWRHLFRVFLRSRFRSRTFIILDGVDEAQRSQLKAFLGLLWEICAEENQIKGQINFLMVGRWDIDWYVEEIFESPVPCVDVLPEKNSEDIKKFISDALKNNRNLKKTSPELQKEILDTLTIGAEGMFLWADFMLKEISAKTREGLVRQSLQKLPKGLPDTYERMFRSFSEALADEPDQIEDLNEILLWVGFANQPLNIAELEVILELRYAEGGRILDLYDELTKKYASLFTISHPTWPSGLESPHAGLSLMQKRTSIVRLRHASLRDFLKLGRSNEMAIGVDIENLHLHFFKTCAKFMADPENMPKEDNQFRLIESTLPFSPSRLGDLVVEKFYQRRPKTVFAYYALQNWFPHLKRVPIGTTSIEKKAEVIGHLHQIFTRRHILAARLQNYMYNESVNIRSNPIYIILSGVRIKERSQEITPGLFLMKCGMVEIVLSWVRDQHSVKICVPEVSSWAIDISGNQSSSLIEPMVKEMYFLALGGGSDLAAKDIDSDKLILLLSNYLRKFSRGPGKIDTDDHLAMPNCNVPFISIDPKLLLEHVPLEKDAVWYLSAANIYFNACVRWIEMGREDLETEFEMLSAYFCLKDAHEHCVEAAKLAKGPEQYALRVQIYYLRYRCARLFFALTDSPLQLHLAKISFGLAVEEIRRVIAPLEDFEVIDNTPWSLGFVDVVLYLSEYNGFIEKFGIQYGWAEDSKNSSAIDLYEGLRRRCNCDFGFVQAHIRSSFEQSARGSKLDSILSRRLISLPMALLPGLIIR